MLLVDSITGFHVATRGRIGLLLVDAFLGSHGHVDLLFVGAQTLWGV